MSRTLAGVPRPAFFNQGDRWTLESMANPTHHFSSASVSMPGASTKTQHAWLRCSSPRAGPLPLGARWDVPGGMVYPAIAQLAVNLG